MDPEQLENLKKEYEKLPDAEILDLLAVDPSEYEPGVFEIVKAEALRRDLKEIKDSIIYCLANPWQHFPCQHIHHALTSNGRRTGRIRNTIS